MQHVSSMPVNLSVLVTWQSTHKDIERSDVFCCLEVTTRLQLMSLLLHFLFDKAGSVF